MSLKNELTEKLEDIADNPQNSFDRIILDNRGILENMNEAQLSDIYMLRTRCEHLCRIIPYGRDEIALLVESGEVDARNKVAELEDCFNIAEYIFTKAKGEEF